MKTDPTMAYAGNGQRQSERMADQQRVRLSAPMSARTFLPSLAFRQRQQRQGPEYDAVEGADKGAPLGVALVQADISRAPR